VPERSGFPDPPGSRRATSTAVRQPAEPDEDVIVAQRGAASFGGGDPTFRELLRDFVHRYGWRAYALPVLVVVTIAALLTARAGTPKSNPKAGSPGGTGHTSSAPPVANSNIALKSDEAGAASGVPLKLGQLPAGPAFTAQGKGTFHILKGTSPKVGTGKLFRYEVEVEDGVTGVDTAEFASTVQMVLSDPRSWSGHGVALQRVDSGSVDFHVSLTSSMTVRQYCGYTIHVETSCYAAAYDVAGLEVNRVFLNVARWVRGAAPYVGDLTQYRVYMINHEDGHALGHHHAHECLAGGLAPAMMQQTFGLKSAVTNENCQANPWPYPPNVKDAPGAEQADTAQNDEYNLQD
jgi:hypothetical protein